MHADVPEIVTIACACFNLGLVVVPIFAGWMMLPWTIIGNHNFGGTIFLYDGAPDYPGP